ncbi:ABC transporter permease [Cryobacterium adonitolivorans]|uniref:ABC transporter permease n=1 Tax=Cryobacterium adonitolivorans TaxID=1259189 RepID=A0A4R8W5C3_9MICO|nr:FtsX-like permease family protein [Cryobacterium adonitolivorans]TFC01820.1 ABC transporter permease [Cryobacterium adonitolivorans]
MNGPIRSSGPSDPARVQPPDHGDQRRRRLQHRRGAVGTIAVYVSSIVTTNTVPTIIAGRTRTIALMRLIGSSARDQRRAVAREGLLVGACGAVLGAIVGTVLPAAELWIAVAAGTLPDLQYSLIDPFLALPVVVVVLSTWCAAWVGSRRVLSVSPMQAVGAAQERSLKETVQRPARNVIAVLLIVVGVLFLAGGVVVGLVSEYGVLVLAVGATIVPARRAVSVAPVTALAAG